MTSRTYLSIGDVLTLLREEFPDVTISKIRFLESQGLVNPERSPSGYRKFFEPDVERLRWVLRQQREHFLPLKVIRDRLAAGDLGDVDVPVGVASTQRNGTAGAAAAGAAAGGAAAGSDGRTEAQMAQADNEAMARILADASRRAALIPESGNQRAPLRVVPDPDRPTPSGGPDADTAAGALAAPASAPDPATEPAAARHPVAAPGGATAPTADAAPTAPPAAATATSRNGVPATGDRTSAHDPAPAGAGTGAGGRGNERRAKEAAPSLGAPRGDGGKSAKSAKSATADPAPATGTATASTGASGPGRSAGTGSGGGRATAPANPAATAATAPGTPGMVTGASLTAEELGAASGLSAAEVAGLQGFGLMEPVMVAGIPTFDEDALTVANLAASFRKFGIEPRHLRLYRNAVDREIGLIEQVIIPLLRQRNPESRQRATQAADELGTLGQAMRATLLRAALRRHVGG